MALDFVHCSSHGDITKDFQRVNQEPSFPIMSHRKQSLLCCNMRDYERF